MNLKYPLLLCLILLACIPPQYNTNQTSQTITQFTDYEYKKILELKTTYNLGEFQKAFDLTQSLIIDPLIGKEAKFDILLIQAKSLAKLNQVDKALAAAVDITHQEAPDSITAEAFRFISSTMAERKDFYNAAGNLLNTTIMEKDRNLLKQDKANLQSILQNLDIAQMEELLAKFPSAKGTPELLYVLARIQFAAENLERASYYEEQLVQKFPQDPLSKDRLFKTEKETKSKPTSAHSGSVKIGLLLPLSGDYKLFGDEVNDGIKIAFEEHNAASKTNIELSTADTKGDPITALIEAKKMIRDSNIWAFIGPVLSMPTIAVAGVADANKIPLISPTATEPRISEIGKYVFQLNPRKGELTYKLAAYSVKELGLKTFAIFYPRDEIGLDKLREFSRGVIDNGGEIIAVEAYERDSTDHQEALERIAVLEPQPQAIYIPGKPKEIVQIAPQVRFVDLVETQIIGDEDWHDEFVIRMGESHVENAIFCDYIRSQSQLEEDFANNFERKYNRAPEHMAFLGYLSFKIISESFGSNLSSPEDLGQNLFKLFYGPENSIVKGVEEQGSIYVIRNKSFVQLVKFPLTKD
jgi:branched-chain amino acid transport system substrate-binding protein